MRNEQHWNVLALLRFFLATIVVSTHLTLPISHRSFFYRWHELGGLAAVCAFLVISGYSIGHSINREPEKFYSRRFWRIYPVYLVSILFAVLVWRLNDYLPTPTSYGLEGGPPPRTILFNLLLVQGFLGVALHSDSPVWSLSVEVSLYTLAPWLRRTTTRGIICAVGLSAAAFLVHEHLPRKPLWYESHGVAAVCIAWAWLLGFLWHRHQGKVWIKILLPLLGGVLLLSFGPSEGRYAPLTFTLVSIVLLCANCIRLSSSLGQICAYLGELSYPLYLIHVPTIILVQQITHTRQPLAYVTASAAAAVLVYHGIDVPCRRLGRRLLAGKEKTVVARTGPTENLSAQQAPLDAAKPTASRMVLPTPLEPT